MKSFTILYTIYLGWIGLVFGTTTYLVFWKDASIFWYILALLLAMAGEFKIDRAPANPTRKDR